MANLTENPAIWETGIYQIEQTDPVLGGAPNVATGAGMSNIPHVQLTNRTAFLKKVIDDTGLGAAAVPLVTLNAAQARITGSYRFASGDANTPASGVAGTLVVVAASASAVNQTAFDSASTRMWTRFWNGTAWSAWAEILQDTQGNAGLISYFARNTAPSGYIKANGAAVSRTTYATLFAAIGTTFGAGNGTTTFNLPDLRGEFPRGWDDGRGVDSGRGFGTPQDGTWLRTLMQEWTGNDTVTSGNLVFGQPHAQPDAVIQNNGGPGGTVPSGALGPAGSTWQSAASDNHVTGNAVVDPVPLNRWIRTRPTNVALLACIKF